MLSSILDLISRIPIKLENLTDIGKPITNDIILINIFVYFYL